MSTNSNDSNVIFQVNTIPGTASDPGPEKSAQGAAVVLDQLLEWLRPLGVVALFLLFLGVPLAIGEFLAFYSLNRWESVQEAKTTQFYEKKLDTLVYLQDNGFLVADYLHELFTNTRVLIAEPVMIRILCDEIQRKLGKDVPFSLSLCALGNEVCSNGTPYAKDLVAKALPRMLSPRSFRGHPAEEQAFNAELAKAFGPGITLAWLQRKNGEFFPVSTSEGKGVAFLENRPDGVSMALIIPRLPPDLLNDFSRSRQPLTAWKKVTGIAVPEKDLWCPPPGLSPRTMALACHLWEKTTANNLEQSGRRWFFARDRFGKTTCLAIPAKTFVRRTGAFKGLFAALGLLGLLGGLRTLASLLGRQKMSFSIKTQLWGLFAYVSLLPLLATCLLAWVGIQEQAAHLQQEHLKKCLERLQVLEGGYPEARRETLRAARAVRHSDTIKSGSRQAIVALMETLKKNETSRFALVVGADGKNIFNSFSGTGNRAMAGIGRVVIKWFSPNRLLPGEENKIDPMELIVEDLSANDNLGMSSVAEYRDHLHSIVLSKKGFDVYWDVFPELATGPMFLVISREQSDVLNSYFEKRENHLKGDYPIFLIENKNQRLRPVPEPALAKTLLKLLTLTYKYQNMLQREVTLPQGIFWVVAMPDAQFNRFSMIAVRDASQTLAPLRAYQQGVVVVIGLSVLIAFLAGHLLSGLFLLPLQDLTAGLQAIRERRTEFRLQKRRDDEFGVIATLFNKTLEDLKELELARVVQAQLFPQTIPQLPGFEVHLENRTASDLGGDYFDVRLLPDGKLLFLIGDATGHGTSAALVMAMAKAVFQYYASRNPFSLDDLSTGINKVFFQELRQSKKFMTMLLGILDPITSTLHMQNAGQTFPVFFRQATQTVEQPEMPGFPMGMRLKPNFFKGSFSMAPGDSVVFLTDGYIESPMSFGDVLGMERFQTYFAGFAAAGLTAKPIIDALFNEFEKDRREGPLDDDITLLAIHCQLPSGNAKQ